MAESQVMDRAIVFSQDAMSVGMLEIPQVDFPTLARSGQDFAVRVPGKIQHGATVIKGLANLSGI